MQSIQSGVVGGGVTQSHKEGAWGEVGKGSFRTSQQCCARPCECHVQGHAFKIRGRVARLAFHARMHELTSDLEGDIKSCVTITDPHRIKKKSSVHFDVKT